MFALLSENYQGTLALLDDPWKKKHREVSLQITSCRRSPNIPVWTHRGEIWEKMRRRWSSAVVVVDRKMQERFHHDPALSTGASEQAR